MRLELFDCAVSGYLLEHLFDSKENMELIADFSVSSNATGLENYLKNCAGSDEYEKNARTYLVKDEVSGEIVGYFSLRNGLIPIRIQDCENECFDTLPAIELSNFAVNQKYKNTHPASSKFGLLIFGEFILPLVKEIGRFSGVNTLYIYALPNDRLISHYETMGFERLPKYEETFVHFHIKPKYDKDCIFMSQRI